LRAHCRSCHQTISFRYPAVELATGIWFAIQAARLHTILSFYFFFANQTGSSYAPFAIVANLTVTIAGFLLIGLMVMDWETGTLPDSFTLTGILLGILLICTQAVFLDPGQGQILLTANSPKLTSAGATTDAGNVFMTGPEALIMGRVLAACGAALLLVLVRLAYKAVRHREGMGLGDVKLFAMITALLGFWPGVLSLFLGTIAASIYGIFQVIKGRPAATTKLPFGSFLAIGGLITAQIGDRVIEAYSQLLR
jgi:leader peptidase (prepilin peptidase)/N-methyltransferase